MSENNFKITPLKGPDRVRKRPNVVFGSTDGKGALVAICDVLNVFIAENIEGYCSKLSVALGLDGSVKISGNGRPIALCDGEGKRWYHIFCELPTAPREGVDPNATHNFMFGDPTPDPQNLPERTGVFYISSVQFCSEFMTVSTFKDGVQTSMRFEKGFCVLEPVFSNSNRQNGTEISFKLDQEIFSDVDVTKRQIEEYLKTTTLPSLDWTVE